LFASLPRPIPQSAHFIWFGAAFPWVNVLAVRSAALRGELERVTLHHDSDLRATPHYRELVETPGVELVRLEPKALFERAGQFGGELARAFATITLPAVRSDLVRLALLYVEGGIYLDTDTITIAPLGPLCEGVEAFCGFEHIVFPADVRASLNPFIRGAALARSLVRDGLRRVPHGYRAFAAIQSVFPSAVNNAVFASAAGGGFITRLLSDLVELPAARQATLFAIGPHLLQSAARDFAPPALQVFPPSVFYPLGPEICEHWFRKQTHPDLTSVLSRDTRVVHWYRSNRTDALTPAIDPDYVRAHAGEQLWSALALPFVGS
jgi:hypothetical protein